MYYNFSLHSHSETWILSFVLLVVSETRAFVFLIILFDQDVFYVNFLAGNIINRWGMCLEMGAW